MCSVEQKPVFRDLSADDPDPEVTEIESLCMNCHANGITRLLLTRIPYYKNVVIMSFSCEECGYENNEIQPGGAFAEMGIRWKLRVEHPSDLSRQLVKSDYTSIRIPEIDLEIPAQSQKGEVTTVEGVLSRVMTGLVQDQDARKEQHPETAAQIELFLERLHKLRDLEESWQLLLEDISGNCFVENPAAPGRDPRCERTDFKRTRDEDHILGIFTRDEVSENRLLTPADPQTGCYEQLEKDEVLSFATNCPYCNAPAETNMKLTNIPHFKEVVIMATTCDACGHRTNEVKSGGGVEEKGVKFEVKIASRDDFSRDILKSETCSMSIAELELETGGRALGGRFTTAEGLLRATADQLRAAGDAPGLASERLQLFIEKLQEVLDGNRAVTIVLDDPAGNSYVQSLADDPTTPDEGVKITRYERSHEQNEELGLNDMKTEGYEES
ncbi:zinc finger protein ZPR1 [Plodia interpunctella]|uniref:zinc finger protein ZPR1 n=1 Tax=Plodia interpunctella TaxID=58824 RepID=UPI00236848CC|nr:zinc finger protein ZPR1-like [Plodia interpunctella]